MYGGPNLSTRTRILENAFAFGLGARGYPVGLYLVFCYVHGGLLQYLQFPNNMAAAPQGPQFFISDVSPDEGFFSSDLLVTPDGDVLVLDGPGAPSVDRTKSHRSFIAGGHTRFRGTGSGAE